MPRTRSACGQRSRTFTGCGGCRSRHLKCDEKRPTCSSCRRLHIPCSYAARLLWVSSDDGKNSKSLNASTGASINDDEISATFRYPLFTDARRTSMSIATVRSLGGKAAADVLADLDDASDDATIGPFGVFSNSKSCGGSASAAETGKEELDKDAQAQLSLDLDQDNEEMVLPGDLPNDFSSYLSTDWMMGISWSHQACDLLPVLDQIPSEGIAGADAGGEEAMDSNTIDPSNIHDNRVISPLDTMPHGALPQHASVLMQHLKSAVLQGAAPTRDMSPWKLLLFPCALETVAEIALWNDTSYARRSILHTMLAKSAYHLSKSYQPTASFWRSIGQSHQTSAKRHLASAIAIADDTQVAVKYPELLMAILSVGAVSIYFDDPQSIRKLLLDAEKLIRSRGLPSTKKLPHRVLHHMYTHLRIVLESTNIAAVISNPLAIMAAPRNFGIAATELGDLDQGRQKPEDIGYNDIHLDVTGTWAATLYPEVIGVSESLVTLLSKTISLVNERPRLEAAGRRDAAISAALSKHVKTLEQQIWSWSGPNDEIEPKLGSLTLAMHQALIIFFYRRVYNTNVMIIQSQVRNTLEHILECLDIGRHDSDLAVSIAWSTFIAASEAASAELQEKGLVALKAVDDYGMFLEQGKPSTISKAVWLHRDKTKDFAFGWPDLMFGIACGTTSC